MAVDLPGDAGDKVDRAGGPAQLLKMQYAPFRASVPTMSDEITGQTI